MKSRLIIVGGFLGAGKTSLLWKAAKHVKLDGAKVGLITNDQASELVDTSFLETGTDVVKEVSGSCFCCNFAGFADAITYITDKNGGGVVIAEPVGSCTDLSPTLMQPLKDKYADSIDLAPLTVLADPFKLREILSGVTSSASYIISKQFEEADVILINKTDLISADELKTLIVDAKAKWNNVTVMSVCAMNDTGIKEWLDTIMNSDKVGTKIAEVDYNIYAEGEAAFGWFNASFEIINPSEGLNKSADQFLTALGNRFDMAGMKVGHVKFLLQTSKKIIIGNLTGKLDTKAIRDYSRNSEKTTLTVNARVEATPDELQNIILGEVSNSFIEYGYEQRALQCLIPGRPNPTYRYDVVK